MLDKSIKSVSERPFVAGMDGGQESISRDEVLKKISNTAAQSRNPVKIDFSAANISSFAQIIVKVNE